MPPRLALMVAAGVLLALGACSGGTKTVTQPPPAPPAPSWELSEDGAAAAPVGVTTITVGPNADEDENGNRYVERFGHRFVCAGDETCIVTVTKDAEGNVSVTASRDLVTTVTGRIDTAPPAPAPRRWMLSAAGAAAAPAGVTTIVVGPDAAVDEDGNRYVDRFGHRFTCTGDDVCIVMVTKDAEGAVSVMAEGELLAMGETIPAAPPAPAPRRWMLSAAGAAAAPAGVTTIVVGANAAVDEDGNRYVDRFGHRFTCMGDDVCIVTVTKDAEGAVSVMAEGVLLAMGETIPATPPAPAPRSWTLADAEAAEAPEGDTVITIRSRETNVDEDGNRYVDRFGHRFVCMGDDVCIVTVTKDAEGVVSVTAKGELLAMGGVIPLAPMPGPIVFLPREAASDFATRVAFSIGGTDSQDTHGSRFLDFRGYRFTCEDTAGCRVVVTPSSDPEGAPLVSVETGTVTPGEVPAVTPLGRAGVMRPGEVGSVPPVFLADFAYRFLKPGPDAQTIDRGGVAYTRDEFTIAAGMSDTRNQAMLSCPADGDACRVVLETRGDVTDLSSTGGLTVLPAYSPWYVGLAYKAKSDANPTWDPKSSSGDLGSALTDFAARRIASTNGRGETAMYFRDVASTRGEDDRPAFSLWTNIANTEIVSAATVTDSETNVFAGFSAGNSLPDEFQGVEPAGQRASFTLTLAGASPVEVELSGAEFDMADARTAAERWRDGFNVTMNRGADTASDPSDDGRAHVRVFTDYSTDGVAAASGFGDFAANSSLTGGRQILKANDDGTVPATAPARQTFAAATDIPATYRGVPGTYRCTIECVVTTDDDGDQMLTGSYFEFTPATGVLTAADDSDWLAFGTWAVTMNNGDTRVGAFFTGNDPFGIVLPSSPDTGNQLITAQGDVTYRGAAHGRYAEFDDGEREAGLFSAAAAFAASFGDATTGGTLEGTLREFSTTAYGSDLTPGTAEERSAWELDFASITFSNTADYGFDLDGVTGKWGAATGQTLAGGARGRFYGKVGSSAINAPKALLGMFAATSDDTDAAESYDLTLIGAFGATLDLN